MNPKTSKRASLLAGSASLLALASAGGAYAAAPAPAVAPVEEVLITGSVISGSAAVGVSVTALSAEDFRAVGALTVADIVRTVPAIEMSNFEVASAGARQGERGARVDLRSRTVGGHRGMLMVDSLRYPGQYVGGAVMDPSIIPEIAVNRVEVLLDGASSLYGSDAVAGVINIILKRNFDGAITQARFGTAISELGGGMERYQFAQLYGRTWAGGSITAAYEFNHQNALDTTDERLLEQFTHDFTPWGLDNRTSIRSARPAIVSTGAPVLPDPILLAESCTNCFSIPAGTGWDYGSQNPGATISWTALSQNKGPGNLVNPYSLSDLSSRTERNSAVLTFDQRILDREILGGVVRGATFNFHAFYNNRRTVYFWLDAGLEFRPTSVNPYYPTGAPAGLRVHYSLVDELNPRRVVSEIAARWSPEIEVELPAGWLGRLGYSVSENKTVFNLENAVNLNMINAALGLTVASQAASEAAPGQAAYTKPANIPFLNVFCDATAHQCNSPATLQYISAYNRASSTHQIHEWNAQLDGPIYMLPGGEVRAGFGAQLRSWNYRDQSSTTIGTHSAALVARPPSGVFARQIPAAYAQLNVPVFSEMNAIPLIQRLELQGSYRYDHYDDAGSIWSPKVGGEYSPGFGLTFRASWGKSFRAPEANDLVAAQSNVGEHNLLGGASSDTLRACPIGSATPVPGSAGARLVALGLASCNGVGAPAFPGGLDATGSAWPGMVNLFRPHFGTGPADLVPETATNTTYGFVYDSELSFLSGLHLEATYWRIEINDTLNHVTAPGQVNLTSPDFAGLVITPDNTGGNFAELIRAALALPGAPTDLNPNNVVFFIDAARRNHGVLLVDGYDFNARYDYDAGNLGAFNVSFAGTYFLKEVISAPGFATIDNLDRDLNAIDMGVSTAPRLKWRGGFGWTDGTFSANFSVNHTGHFHTDQVLTAATAQFPDWTNMLPAHTWLDMSVAYNTGTTPVNPYLQNINLQLTVNDVLDQRAPFAYATAGRGVQAAAFWSERGGGYSPVGRYVTFYVTKQW